MLIYTIPIYLPKIPNFGTVFGGKHVLFSFRFFSGSEECIYLFISSTKFLLILMGLDGIYPETAFGISNFPMNSEESLKLRNG